MIEVNLRTYPTEDKPELLTTAKLISLPRIGETIALGQIPGFEEHDFKVTNIRHIPKEIDRIDTHSESNVFLTGEIIRTVRK